MAEEDPDAEVYPIQRRIPMLQDEDLYRLLPITQL